MSLDTVTYTAIATTQDTAPTEHEVEVADVVQRLTTHSVVATKESAGLFSFCRFSPGGGRKATHATYVDAIVLDFDNTVVERIPGQGGMNLKKTQTCIPNPVTPQAVEAMLRAANVRAVVVTSHNHKPHWPKFRVIAFCDDSIPANIYNDIVGEFLAYTGLGSPSFAAGLDRSCLQPARFYYWPTHDQAGASTKFAAYVDAENYELTETVLKAPQPKPGRPTLANGQPAAGQWTSQQISNYYRYAVPTIQNHTAVEAKACCPIHGGTNPRNFTVDLRTGFWHCFSECAANGLRGGGIYAFHWHWRNAQLRPYGYAISYSDAKREVTTLIGHPAPSSLAAFQQNIAAIPAMTPQQVTDTVQSINALPPAERPAAVAALQAAQPTIPQAVIQEHVMLPHPSQDASSMHLGGMGGSSFGAGGNLPFPQGSGEGSTRSVRIRQEFGTRINTTTHDLKDDGVFVLKAVGTGEKKEIQAIQIAPVPIWVSRSGIDNATGIKWYKVNWRDGAGEVTAIWVKMNDLNRQPEDIFQNFPVDLQNKINISNYFNWSIAEFDKDLVRENVSTRYGWQPVRLPDGSKGKELVLYPADAAESGGNVTVVVPPMLEPLGQRTEWIKMLQQLLAQPFDDFRGLWAMLGMSAAAPMTHFLDVRNPIVYVAGASGSGKTTIANFALALWGDPGKLQVAASSTAKGIDDKVFECQDLPFFVEEFQRQSQGKDSKGLTPEQAEAIIYALANGKRRSTSGKDKKSHGGEDRRGVNFIVSEETLTSQFAKGAGARILTLKEEHFVPTPEWSQDVLKPFANEHGGALGPELQAAYNKNWRIYKADYNVMLKQLRAAGAHFTGDDLPSITLIALGLQVLQRVTGLTLPVQQTVQYVMQSVAPSRTTLRDELNWEDRIFVDLITAIQNSLWGAGGVGPDYCDNMHGAVAMRGTQLMYPQHSELEIAIDSTVMRAVLQRHGAKKPNELMGEWFTRGYLLKDPARKYTPYKFSRKNVNGVNENDFRGKDTNVICVTAFGMSLASRY